MVLKLFESIKRQGSALLIDRDIAKAKGELGIALYDELVQALEDDANNFLSTESDMVIVTVRPFLLTIHREVVALLKKRSQAVKILDEQSNDDNNETTATPVENLDATASTSTPTASKTTNISPSKWGNLLWTTAKYKSQVVL